MRRPSGGEGDLGGLVQRTALDPARFAELVAAWNEEFDPEKGLNGPASLVDAADGALQALAAGGDRDLLSERVARVINSFSHIVVVTSAEGTVLAMNTLAMARLDLGIGEPVDRIAYQLEAAERISDVIRGLGRPTASGEIVLKRAVEDATDRPATLAFVQVPGRGQRDRIVLLFVIDPERREEAEALMAHAYGLTSAEAEVVSAFLEGSSLHAIAKQRGRSQATVRTQFQTAMSKTGARTQAELMRNTLALSQFVSEISDLTEVARHPHRKAAQILRPGGRTLDVVLAGALTPDPSSI